jgi:lipid A 3-O-deacylase
MARREGGRKPGLLRRGAGRAGSCRADWRLRPRQDGAKRIDAGRCYGVGSFMNYALKMVLSAAAAASLLTAGAARADDLFGGLYAHGIGVAGREQDSFDTMVGYRTNRLDWASWIFRPQAHIIVSVNDKYSTDFVAAGFDWRVQFSKNWYLRPGIGLAYTTGKAGLPPSNVGGLTPMEENARLHLYYTRIDFGDHYLFEPELALGYNIDPKWALELSYVHLSNGQILHQGKNQGLDDAGLRLNYHFR